MLSYKQNFEQAQKYWDAFWAHELLDRPCCSIIAPRNSKMPEICRLIDVNDDFSKAFSKYDSYFENVEFLGDAMPSFRLNFGPDQFAAFLGAPIKVSEDGWTRKKEKIVDNWESFMPLKIDENNIYWKRMIEYHKAAEKYFRRS